MASRFVKLLLAVVGLRRPIDGALLRPIDGALPRLADWLLLSPPVTDRPPKIDSNGESGGDEASVCALDA